MVDKSVNCGLLVWTMMVHVMVWWWHFCGQTYKIVDLSTHVKIKDLVCPHFIHSYPLFIHFYRSKYILCPQFVHYRSRQNFRYVHNLTTIHWFVHHLTTPTLDCRKIICLLFIHLLTFIHCLSTHTFGKSNRSHLRDLTCVSLQPSPHIYQLSYC